MAQGLLGAASGGPADRWYVALLPLWTLVAGALLGGIGTYLVDRRRERAEIRREARAASEQRRGVVRQRAERAMEAIDGAMSALSRDMSMSRRELARESKAAGGEQSVMARQERIRDGLDFARTQALYLEPEWSQRVVLILELMRDADELAPGPYGAGHHYATQHEIVGEAVRHSRAVAAALLRHEDLPALTSMLHELAYAADQLEADRRLEFAQEIHEDEQRRTAWLQANPKYEPVTHS